MAGRELDISTHNHTLVATVERGEQNLFSGAMIDELIEAVRRAGAGGGVRFVRLRARGAVFCVGREREGTTSQELRAEAARIVTLNETLRSSPLTIVAEVQGDAAGFGAGMVAAADVAVAASGARFWFPEILGGLAPSVVISWLSKAVPHKVAFDLVATGRALDATEAQRLGLITEAVLGDRLERAVDERIERLAATSAGGLREIKEFFSRTRALDAPDAAWASVDPLVLSTLRIRNEQQLS